MTAGPSVPEAARAAARIEVHAGDLADCERENNASHCNLACRVAADAAIEAAAPFIVAAAVAEERATTGRAVGQVAGLFETLASQTTGHVDVPPWLVRQLKELNAMLRAALASPGERCSTCDQPLDSPGCSVGMNGTPAHTVGGGCQAASPREES